MNVSPQTQQQLVSELRGCCGVAAQVARVLVKFRGRSLDEGDFCRHISSTDRNRFSQAVNILANYGFCRNEAGRWRATSMFPDNLADFLQGATAMELAIGPVVHAEAVITTPGPGSYLNAALPATGISYAALKDTKEVFYNIAVSAKDSLCILTPFLNQAGLDWAFSLFSITTARRKELIIRSSVDVERLLSENAQAITDLAVTIRNYKISLNQHGHYETFHAKIILADDTTAYVGSCNMLEYERRSLELGFAVDGSVVHPIAALVDAIRRISKTVDPAYA